MLSESKQNRVVEAFKDTYYLYRILYSQIEEIQPTISYKKEVSDLALCRKAIIEDLKSRKVSNITKPYVKAIFYSSLLREHLNIPTARTLEAVVDALNLIPLSSNYNFYYSLFQDLERENIQFSCPEDNTFSKDYKKIVEDFYLCFNNALIKCNLNPYEYGS